MRQLKINLEHCYGIKKFDHDFDFSQNKAFAIYAPNGVMKSSFAKTFDDLSKQTPSKDQVFPGRVTVRNIVDENGAAIDPSKVFVIQSYDEFFGHNERTSTLLVNSELKREYEELHRDISAAKDKLFQAIRKSSGTKKDIEKEISSSFTATDKEFYKAIKRIHGEVMDQADFPFANIKYDTVFEEKALEFLNTSDFKTAIEEYIRKYNELIGKSNYFKKGVFNYYNAATIAKSLADNGFFKAKHTIRLNSGESVEVENEKQLVEIINKEKDEITNDPDLKKKYDSISKLLEKNATVRGFETYLSENEDILPLLSNLRDFKEKIWKSYFVANKEIFNNLVESYKTAERRRTEIESLAGAERTQWEEVIAEFNDRFFVPFTLEPKNKVAVMLGEEPILSLGFIFNDGADSVGVERGDLLKVLSTGEKKALYILNILFEIAVRRASGVETLLIVDDIADSFDYKNKYAIVQYLKDISESGTFKEIILTHNFDFFRTIQSRFVSYSCCSMVLKDGNGIKFVPSTGIKNIFVNDWKGNFATDANKAIACIPFMRNLIEFTKGEADPDFIALTSLLHWKGDTETISAHDLYGIYNRLFGTAIVPVNPALPVFDTLKTQATACLTAPQGVNFENKIVLSIASRLLAEKHIIDTINDPAKTSNITGNQTAALVSKYKREFSTERAKIRILDKVALMTPENIHLNSFMYEPILDMSDDHLRQLYSEVSAL